MTIDWAPISFGLASSVDCSLETSSSERDDLLSSRAECWIGWSWEPLPQTVLATLDLSLSSTSPGPKTPRAPYAQTPHRGIPKSVERHRAISGTAQREELLRCASDRALSASSLRSMHFGLRTPLRTTEPTTSLSLLLETLGMWHANNSDHLSVRTAS